MEVEEYLGRSRLDRRLRGGPHGQRERYAARLVEEGLVRHGAWRCLNVVGRLVSWIAGRLHELVDLDEQVVERYLRHPGGRQSIPARKAYSCRSQEVPVFEGQERFTACAEAQRCDGTAAKPRRLLRDRAVARS